MSSFFRKFQPQIKKEPVDSVSIKIEPVDDDTDSTTDMHEDWSHNNFDPDADVDDKRKMPPPPPQFSRTTVSSNVVKINNESMVRNVTLTPTSRSLAVTSSTLANESRVFGLDEYDEPSQNSLASGRAGGERSISDSAQSAAAFTNYVMVRASAGGQPIRNLDNNGYGAAFIRQLFEAPPHRSMPVSNTEGARLRLDATPLSFDHFTELCATALADQLPCCMGERCHSLKIRNRQGYQINNSRFVAFWHDREAPRFAGPGREAFLRELSQRMCIQCKIEAANRIFVHSACTNTPANVSADVKLAVDFFVLVNRDGEFQQCQTIGPDATCFNGLIGNVPRITIDGWSVRPTNSTARVEFEPPYQRYPAAVDAATRDGARGF